MRDSFGLRALALLLLFSATLGTAQAQLVDALNRAYKRAADDFKGYGLDDTVSAGIAICSVRGAWLVKGEAKISSPILTPGVEYVIIAAGNSHIKKLKLQILDAKKKAAAKEGDPVITESSEDNNAPGCTVMLDKAKYGTKPYTLGVRMEIEEMESTDEKNDGWVCYMILQKDAGWEVPLENFEKATAGLQARLDAMIAAHPNGAEISHDSIPLQGVVLKANGVATVVTPYPAGKKYRLVAASDENTEALSIGLGGNLIAATTQELGDFSPKLTYTRGLTFAAPNTGSFSVRNKSKETALVLTVAITLVEGN
jgi:hypothetical protein